MTGRVTLFTLSWNHMSSSNDYILSTITLFDYIFHREASQLPRHCTIVCTVEWQILWYCIASALELAQLIFVAIHESRSEPKCDIILSCFITTFWSCKTSWRTIEYQWKPKTRFVTLFPLFRLLHRQSFRNGANLFRFKFHFHWKC